MDDNLTIDYEVFEEEGIKVLTVGRGDCALRQFYGDEAEAVYNFLTNRPLNSDKFVTFVDISSVRGDNFFGVTIGGMPL